MADFLLQYLAEKMIPVPCAIIYLDAPVYLVKERIEERGRLEEQEVSFKYLETLKRQYDIYLKEKQNAIICSIDVEKKSVEEIVLEIIHFLNDRLYMNIPIEILAVEQKKKIFPQEIND